MTYKNIFYGCFFLLTIISCSNARREKESHAVDSSGEKGTFAYDLHFLQQQDDSLVVLQNHNAEVIVSPKYQAKVFTSTAGGENGKSFGWINYGAFGAPKNEHMNVYGGENRLWLGPEGGRFSLFFEPGITMNYDNWKTPAPFDTESWQVLAQSPDSVLLQKHMQLTNYIGTPLQLTVNRTVKMLTADEINDKAGLTADTGVRAVGYVTRNVLTNTGGSAWTKESGMPCLWILDMLKASPNAVTVLPFRNIDDTTFEAAVNSGYFGQIDDDRLKHDNNKLFYNTDGNSRGKLSVLPAYAKTTAGNYNPATNTLTVVVFDLDSTADYLGQEWNTNEAPFSGDAVNVYNDGPLADGTQTGLYSTIESLSPAAYLQPAQSLTHLHTVYHFTGDGEALDAVSQHMLGISLGELKSVFTKHTL